MAMAAGLDQKHVVLIEMGADAAALGGVADHDVFQTPARHEAEIVQQQAHRCQKVVHGLYQQGPVPLAQALERILFQRSLLQRPGALAGTPDQPGFHLRFQRQSGQGVGVGVVKAAGGGGHEQRAPLPVPLEKGLRRQWQREAGQLGGQDQTARACWPALPT